MANINFPSSPTDGQTYTFGTFTWKWVAATGTWDAISTSLSPPYGPSGAVQYNAAGAFGGATAFTSDGNGNVTIGATGSLTYNPGASGGVLYTNGSKVVTSGTALTFDGTNLGVGTSSPGQKLEVAGNILISTSGNPTMTVKTSGAGNNPGYLLTADTNTWGMYGIFSDTNDTLQWQYNGGSKLWLTNDGNLGLGVTPKTYSSEWKAIDLGKSGATYGGLGQKTTGVCEAFFGWNAYGGANSTGLGIGYYYKQSGDTASLYTQNGGHAWWVAPSGTAGNAITFTQAMTLDASGNLLVANLAGSGNRAVYSDASGNLTNSSSDERLKESIAPLSGCLQKTLALNPVSYKWIDYQKMGSQTEIGLIAQDVEPIVPEVVGMNYDGTKSIDYPKLVALLAGAIQELTARVAQLEGAK